MGDYMVKMVGDTYTDKQSTRERTFRYDNDNPNDLMILKEIDKLIDKLQPTCFNCVNFFYEGYFGSYQACACKIYGCLEHCSNPHYDCDGSKCGDYKRWC